MYTLLRSKTEAPTEEEIEDNLAGNLWYAQFQATCMFPHDAVVPDSGTSVLLPAIACIAAFMFFFVVYLQGYQHSQSKIVEYPGK